VQLFEESQVPWADLAFRTVATTLQLFFADRARGAFGTHTRHLSPASPRPAR
jgi:hypothetical protein